MYVRNFDGKTISIELVEKCTRKGVSVELRREAELHMEADTSLADIFNFMKNVKKIQSALGECRLTIYVGIYTMKDGDLTTLHTEYSDFWSYEGIPQYDNEGVDNPCVYLMPDERYTRETRDLVFPVCGNIDDLISEIGSVGKREAE